MASKTWTIELAEPVASSDGEDDYRSSDGVDDSFSWRSRAHRIDLHHSYWTAKRTICLDGIRLPPDAIRSYSIYGVQSDDLFVVDGHVCVAHIRTNGVTYNYDLIVDGISAETGQPVDIPWQVIQARTGGKDAMPGWAWLFIALCLIVGLGSALAGIVLASLVVKTQPPEYARLVHVFVTGVVVQAVYATVTTSKDPRWTPRGRMLRCAFILGRTALIVTAAVALVFAVVR